MNDPDPLSRPTTAELVHVALGSNLGDRMKVIETAIDLMSSIESIQVKRCSGVYETEPEGPSTNRYYNMAVEVLSTLDPLEMLSTLKAIEARMGRKETIRWGDRIIDLDIVLWGSRIIESPALTIPHPRMHQREFVLRPLGDLRPRAVHPVLGKTMAELFSGLERRTARMVLAPSPGGCLNRGVR